MSKSWAEGFKESSRLGKGFDPGPVGLRSRGKIIIDPLFKRHRNPAFKKGGSKARSGFQAVSKTP